MFAKCLLERQGLRPLLISIPNSLGSQVFKPTLQWVSNQQVYTHLGSNGVALPSDHETILSLPPGVVLAILTKIQTFQKQEAAGQKYFRA